MSSAHPGNPFSVLRRKPVEGMTEEAEHSAVIIFRYTKPNAKLCYGRKHSILNPTSPRHREMLHEETEPVTPPPDR